VTGYTLDQVNWFLFFCEAAVSKPQSKDEVIWSSRYQTRSAKERRSGLDRRKMSGRAITVPDMRSGIDRRSGQDRRNTKRLTITGRAIDI